MPVVNINPKGIIMNEVVKTTVEQADKAKTTEKKEAETKQLNRPL